MLEEAVGGSGDLCGSTFLNRIFDDWLRKKFENFPKWNEDYHRDALYKFETQIKRDFSGRLDKSYHLLARGLGTRTDWGIQSGKVEIKGSELVDIFEPVIKKILNLVRNQIAANNWKNNRVDRVLLAGGFGRNKYLLERIKREVGSIQVQSIDNAYVNPMSSLFSCMRLTGV